MHRALRGLRLGNGTLGNLSADRRTTEAAWRLGAGIPHWEEKAKIKAGMKAGDQVENSGLRNEKVETRRFLVWEYEVGHKVKEESQVTSICLSEH